MIDESSKRNRTNLTQLSCETHKKSCPRPDGSELRMGRVELQTFIGGDGANGNRADTVVNDGVIDLDDRWLRNTISDVESPGRTSSDGATL